ncbi:hypothetical protein K7G98_36280, partial [Saccharothrix sp. MB29]|nr:hypothetical protein [Saccharothrix sp. MB29]
VHHHHPGHRHDAAQEARRTRHHRHRGRLRVPRAHGGRPRGRPTLNSELARRRGPGLRTRITLLATGLVAFVSGLLLLLGWLLVGRVIATSPRFAEGSTVFVDGREVYRYENGREVVQSPFHSE